MNRLKNDLKSISVGTKYKKYILRTCFRTNDMEKINNNNYQI